MTPDERSEWVRGWESAEDACFRIIRHGVITGWHGHVAEAWDEEWSAPLLKTAPFSYLDWLRIDVLGEDRPLEMVAHLDNGELWCAPSPFHPCGAEVAVPDADLSGLPLGAVEHLEVRRLPGLHGPAIHEVELTVNGSRVLIVAGDVVEGNITWADEQVLVFTDPEAANGLFWNRRECAVSVVD